MNEDFWSFSLRVYAADGVSAACLAMQDHYDADVNLLLYCCWLGRRGTALDAAGLSRALSFAAPWAEHVVRPLRHARAWMKAKARTCPEIPADDYAGLREAIKALELRAERLEQLALETLDARGRPAAPSADTQLHAMIANLERYLSGAGVALDGAVAEHLGTIVEAAAAATPAAVNDALRAAMTSEPARD